MASVGEKLRNARLDGGLELSQVAERTKIGSRYLDAIERDDRTTLPGGFFYKNWVLQYAACLSLDLAEISSEVDRSTAQDAAPALPGEAKLHRAKEEQVDPIDLRSAGERSRFLVPVAALVGVVLACSGLYAVWKNLEVSSTREASTATQVQAVQSTAPAASLPAASIPPKDEVQIEIAATQETWVSVTPDGKEAFSGILEPPQVRTLDAHDSALIKVGNAGGLSIRLNGKPIGPIGTSGQVRTVLINKSGFQIVEPKPVIPEGASTERAPIASSIIP